MEPFKQKLDSPIDRFCEMSSTTPEVHVARAKAIAEVFPEDLENPRDRFGGVVVVLLTDLTARGAS